MLTPVLIRDHARGNEALVQEVPGLRVYGGDDRIEGLTDKVTNEQELKVQDMNSPCGSSTAKYFSVLAQQVIAGSDDSSLCVQFNSINVRCLFTPCHTSGHMCYFVWEDECADAPAVFTGRHAGNPTDDQSCLRLSSTSWFFWGFFSFTTLFLPLVLLRR